MDFSDNLDTYLKLNAFHILYANQLIFHVNTITTMLFINFLKSTVL